MRKTILCMLLLLSAIVVSAQTDDIPTEDPQAVRDSLLLEAELGDTEAMYDLALDYLYGEEPDSIAACKWIMKAAEADNASAQYALGYFYTNGVGVEPDSIAAREWFIKSANGGDSDGQVWMGNDLSNQDTEESKIEAVEWYMKSAAQDNTDAMYNLGVCYEYGDGVERNLKKAYEYYRKVKQGGDEIGFRAILNLYRTRLDALKDFKEKDADKPKQTETTENQ